MENSKNIALNNQGLAGIAVYYGFIAALVSAILTLINHIAGTSDWSNVTIGVAFYFALIIVCTVTQAYAVRFYRDAHLAGAISFTKAFVICVIVCGCASVLSSLVNYLFIVYVDPDVVQRILHTIEKTLEEKHVNPAQIDQALKIAAHNVSPSAQFVSVTINGIVWGILTGLIVSLSLKKQHSQ